MDLTTVYDCMGSNLGKFDVPPGVLLALYLTGSDGVPATPAQRAAHPNALLIDQAPANTPANELADVLDVEPRAATLSDLAEWVHAARTAYALAIRPGQREPTVYMSRSNVTPVVNTLVAAGIASGVNLWVAEEITAKQAAGILEQSGGPFPIIGVQYQFNDDHDESLFSTAYLNKVSVKPPASQPGPGTQTGWRFCRKCQGLFWGPGESRSHCPVGAQHDGSQSHEYTLGFTK